MLQNIINRPVLATVISIILVCLGLLGLTKLPRTLFPDIAPPSVYVIGSYPGGNSESVTRSVVIPLEEAINGVEGMQYITSTAGSDGSFFITVVFELGTNPDQAAVNVQNRVAQVNSMIPSEVLLAGITTEKRQNSNIMMFNLNSDDENKYDELFLQNYAKINLVPAIKRIKGVGNVQIYGTKDYSIRIWLDPQKLTVNGLTPSDIEEAIGNASFEASPGKLGSESTAPIQYTVKYKGKLNTQEDFEKVVIKAKPDGSMLRIKDVARVEFGASFYDSDNKENGKPAVTLAIQQTSGSNANTIETEVRELLETISSDFPKGVDYYILQSTKERLDDAVSQVFSTLFEAFLLVILVVFLILQDFRSTLIPAIAVPVSIVGSFFFLYLFGFSVNVLTLFALVLAIGIVVDDAIVVVEAVYSKIEHGQEPEAATRSAMREITGVIISITLVMCAVFLPVGFMEGPAGVFYKQFAYTLVFAILISAINALTLSPVLCALFLRNAKGERSGYYRLKDNFFKGFNSGFKALSDRYVSLVKLTTRHRLITGGALVAIACLAFLLMNRAPKDFVPEEDDSFVIYSLTLPAGTNLPYTTAAIDRIDSALKVMPEVESVTSISGFGMLSDNTGSNYGAGFIRLKPSKERGKIRDMNEIIEAMNTRLDDVRTGELFLFRSPAVEGFGSVTGAEMIIQDKTGGDLDKFTQITQELVDKLNKSSAVSTAFTSFRSDYPQFEIEVDEDKAYQLGTTPKDVLNTLQLFYGGSQSSDFIRFGKFYRVNIKAEGQYRMDEESLSQVFVKTGEGDMIPINALIQLKKVYGPESVTRYNLYNSISLNIIPAIGYSNGQSMAVSEEIAKTLPAGYGYEWTGLSKEEKESSSQMLYILILCVMFTYFLLAAQYESYLLPLAVIFSIPTGLLGVYLGTGLAGITNNIYVQIGLIMLVGLLAKNAILIVEFASQARRKGDSIVEAAVNGAKQRFRPILMTSLAFIIGLIPLSLTAGASASGNKAISIAAISGMLSGVILGVIFVPLLYIVFQSLQERFTRKKKTAHTK